MPPARLVIAVDLRESLEKYLPPNRFEAWSNRESAREGQAVCAGMGFIASDGQPTAVVIDRGEEQRSETLALCCHELCELSIDSTDGEDRVYLDDAMSTVVWSEHVVERRRTEVSVANGWPMSVLDQSFLRDLWTNYQGDFPVLIAWAVRNNAVPDDVYGHWQLLTREMSCALGRGRAGNRAEQDEATGLIAASPPDLAAAWRGLSAFCDEAYQSPDLGHEKMDALGLEVWHGIYQAFSQEWNQAYESKFR